MRLKRKVLWKNRYVRCICYGFWLCFVTDRGEVEWEWRKK
jgi:hypothetical protein